MDRVEIAVSEALRQLAELGIRRRENISDDDLLLSLGGTMDSGVDLTTLLCLLGGEVEDESCERISNDIWHLDAECIYDTGAYVELVTRFVILAKGALPLSEISDHVNLETGEAWVEFTLDGTRTRWELEVNNDWVDPQLYSRIQGLGHPRGGGKRFFITALGQDSLISYGDPAMKDALSQLTGLAFAWE